MKKLLIALSIIISIFVFFKDDSIIIPANSIRFRVIASSNSIDDQIIKNKLSIDLEKYIIDLIPSDSKSKAFDNVLSNYNNINNHISDYFKKNNINQKYELSIGKNYFPKKEYKGIEYEAGYYDSIVVNLGNKKGINWWCVVYPPLCLIDENVTNKEYTTLAKELIKNV